MGGPPTGGAAELWGAAPPALRADVRRGGGASGGRAGRPAWGPSAAPAAARLQLETDPPPPVPRTCPWLPPQHYPQTAHAHTVTHTQREDDILFDRNSKSLMGVFKKVPCVLFAGNAF